MNACAYDYLEDEVVEAENGRGKKSVSNDPFKLLSKGDKRYRL